MMGRSWVSIIPIQEKLSTSQEHLPLTVTGVRNKLLYFRHCIILKLFITAIGITLTNIFTYVNTRYQIQDMKLKVR